MHTDAVGLPIGAFAAAASVNVETVRYYQRVGLLNEPSKPSGSIRRYGTPDVDRVRFIKSAQRLGFSLDEIRGLLALDDGTHCSKALALGRQKLGSVRERLADLRRIESALARLVTDCENTRGTVSCPLIAALQNQ
jgi:MerR family mercuric resistance operon transcriptional regulator